MYAGQSLNVIIGLPVKLFGSKARTALTGLPSATYSVPFLETAIPP